MTFYLQEKKTDKLVLEFKIHSFDIYPRELDDNYEINITTGGEYEETQVLDTRTGEIVLMMKNTTVWYVSDDYYLILEDA